MVNGSICLLVQIMLAKTVAPLTEFECSYLATMFPPDMDRRHVFYPGLSGLAHNTQTAD